MAELLIQYASAGYVQLQSRRYPNAAIWWAGQITWFIIAAAIICGIGGLIGQEYSRLMGVLSPLWTILILVSIAVLVRGLRKSWDAATLEYTEQAVRLNLPIPGMLRAAETGEGRFVRKRIRRLRTQIEEGASVGDALSRALPGLPHRISGLIVSGERCGRLAPTMRRIVEQDRRRIQLDPVQRIYLRWYPIIILLAIGGVMTGIGIFGMPKIVRLWRDFKIPVPWAGRIWISVSNAAPFALPIAGALAILVCAQLMITLFHPRYGGPGPLRRWTDWINWHLPILRNVVRGRALGDVCDLLAGSVESGMTLHAVLIEATEVRTNAVLQRRIRKWAGAIELGLGTEEAARAARMPAIIVGLISSADGTPDLSNVFRFLARYYDSQFSRAATLVEGAVIPGISIVFGIATLLVLLSVYLPLIEIMKHLMPKGTSW